MRNALHGDGMSALGQEVGGQDTGVIGAISADLEKGVARRLDLGIARAFALTLKFSSKQVK